MFWRNMMVSVSFDSSNSTHLIRRGKSCKLLRITPTIPTAGHPSMLELGRVQPGLVFVSDDEIAEPDVLLNTKDDNAEMIWCLFTLN